jgi:hypothetical protein
MLRPVPNLRDSGLSMTARGITDGFDAPPIAERCFAIFGVRRSGKFPTSRLSVKVSARIVSKSPTLGGPSLSGGGLAAFVNLYKPCRIREL